MRMSGTKSSRSLVEYDIFLDILRFCLDALRHDSKGPTTLGILAMPAPSSSAASQAYATFHVLRPARAGSLPATNCT